MRNLSLGCMFFAMISVAAVPAVAQAPADAGKFIGYQNEGDARASKLIGVVVRNKAGEIVGDISDVVLQPNGQAIVFIVGVGGFLGVGEKNVGVPYSAIAITKDKDGTRSATLDATKAALEAAPSYVGERTTFEKVEDGAASLAKSAAQTAKELKDRLTAPAPADAPK